MLPRIDDTITAISSAPGGAARGIVRVSGPSAAVVVGELFTPHGDARLKEIRLPTALPGVIRLPGLESPLPADLFLWPTNRSYTRQPLAEFHVLGSPPLLEWLLETLCQHGARLAEPGEFTLRAFLAGRMDLTQAEAVLGVIDADDSRRLEAALRQLAGGLSGPLAAIREALLNVLAHLEAGLDFVEDDVEFITAAQLVEQVAQAQAAVARLAGQLGARVREDGGFRVVLVGWPNVGKSSLFNTLTSGQAIVSPAAGTTRDYLIGELTAASGGGPRVELIDTAGVELGPQAQSIAANAQTLSRRELGDAALRLFCVEAGRPLNDWERGQLESPDARRMVVVTKAEGLRRLNLPAAGISVVETSARTGAGIAELRAELCRRAAAREEDGGQMLASTAQRCRDSLRLAGERLGDARELATARAGEELVAAELRLAVNELGKVAGAVYTDDVLDRVFSRFCIGK